MKPRLDPLPLTSEDWCIWSRWFTTRGAPPPYGNIWNPAQMAAQHADRRDALQMHLCGHHRLGCPTCLDAVNQGFGAVVFGSLQVSLAS